MDHISATEGDHLSMRYLGCTMSLTGQIAADVTLVMATSEPVNHLGERHICVAPLGDRIRLVVRALAMTLGLGRG